MKKWIRNMSLIAVALSAAMETPGMAAETVQADENREIVAKAMYEWAAGTGGPYDLLADNAVWTISGNSLASKTYTSKEAFISEVIVPFNARMSTRLIPSVHALYAVDNTVVAHFDAKGTARDGKPYVNSYAWILTLRNGQIVRAHAYFDAHAFDDLWTRIPPQTGKE